MKNNLDSSFSSLLNMTARPFIQSILKDTKPQHHVLHLGGRNAEASRYFADKIPKGQLIGIDGCPERLRVAKTLNRDLKNTSFQAQKLDSFSLPYTFDWVVSFFCLEWETNKPKVFQNIASHLTPNGQVRLIMSGRNPYLHAIRHHFQKHNKWSEYFDLRKNNLHANIDDQYQEYALDAGLENVTYNEKQVIVKFQNRHELKTFIRSGIPAIEKLSKVEDQDVFLEEFIDNYLEIIPEITGMPYYLSCEIKTLTATHK